MKYDEILVRIGEFGPYQKRIMLLLILPGVLSAAQMTINIFMTSLPLYRCKIPAYPNDTYAIQNTFHENLVSTFVPLGGDNGRTYSGCNLYSDFNSSHTSPNSSLDKLNADNANMINRSTNHCTEWVYDTREFLNTMMTEFDAVCGDTFLRSLGNSVFAAGMAGSILVGIFSDIFGRKKGMLLAVVLQLIASFGVYLSTDMYVIIGLRFISGIAVRCFFAIGCTTAIELVGPSKRTIAGMAPDLTFILGGFIAIAIAYILREWRNIQLVIGIVTIPYLSLWWFLPESPRWLLNHRKYDEAKEILEKICNSNKTQLPHDAIDEDTTTEGPKVKISKTFTNRVLLIRTLVIFFNWFACSCLYLGLNFNVENLAGSLYTNYLLTIVVEAFAYVLCFYLLNKTGRKTLYLMCIFVSGVACLSTVVPIMLAGNDLQWITITLSLIGKLGTSAAYAILYIMSAELFPTVVRNTAVGLCSIFESFGGVVAPVIADLGVIVGGHFAQALPMIVFGLVGTIGGFLAIILPETLNKKLPDTIQDAIDFGKTRLDLEREKIQRSDEQSTELMNRPAHV